MEGSKQLLCINCRIKLNTPSTRNNFRILEHNARLVSLISNWISPLIVSEEDYVCKTCFDLAIQAVNDQLDHSDRCAGPPLRGHQKVCLMCGRSVAKRQHYKILNLTSAQHSEIILIIQNKIAPREIQSSDYICLACFTQVKRRAIRNKEISERIIMETSTKFDCTSNIEDQQSENLGPPGILEARHSPLFCDTENIETSEPQIEKTNKSSIVEEQHSPLFCDIKTLEPQTEKTTKSSIVLRNYRRAPNTASHCIFHGCGNVLKLHVISNALRKTLLTNQNYYVPKLSKICSEHLTQNKWHTLYDAENSMSLFTAEHIEHMLSFSKVV